LDVPPALETGLLLPSDEGLEFLMGCFDEYTSALSLERLPGFLGCQLRQQKWRVPSHLSSFLGDETADNWTGVRMCSVFS
jgi:hypothetical protein